ncbi:MAG: RloB family protein [Victivallales bacterium]|jgi:hypothetical protein|nr:RloB family protein [Victivallales bacterium]
MSYNFAKRKTPRCPKRIIVIAAEGTSTEPEYFTLLNSMSETTAFFIVPNLGGGSDPGHVLTRMEKYLRENPLNKNDEAWIVIDRDKWTDKQLASIENWAKNNRNCHYAISIRKFEDFLKLHVSTIDANGKYREFLCGGNKHVPDDFVNKNRVRVAIDKAEKFQKTPKSVGNVFEILSSFFKSEGKL